MSCSQGYRSWVLGSLMWFWVACINLLYFTWLWGILFPYNFIARLNNIFSTHGLLSDRFKSTIRGSSVPCNFIKLRSIMAALTWGIYTWFWKVSWRGPKWSWLVEFSEMNAIFCNQTQTFIGGQINQISNQRRANTESN